VRLRLLSVGRDRSGLYQPAVDEYAGRIARFVRFDLVVVPEARRRAGTAGARDEEGEALLARLGERERLVALDERGREPTSAELAQRLQRWLAGGRDVALAVGGADGLAPAVLERAEERISLSRLTLPHRLARLVVAEQLYRAFTILKGEPYHRP